MQSLVNSINNVQYEIKLIKYDFKNVFIKYYLLVCFNTFLVSLQSIKACILLYLN